MDNPFDAFDGSPSAVATTAPAGGASASGASAPAQSGTGNPFDAFDGSTSAIPAKGVAAATSAWQPPEYEKGVLGEDRPSTVRSLAMSPVMGAYDAAASTIGAPVDFTNWGMRKMGLPVSDTPIGGSASIKHALGLFHANPDAPENEARGTAERIARGIGGGAMSMALPEAALSTVAGGLGRLAPKTTEFLQGVFGSAKSTASVAGNAGLGAVGGATGAAAEEAVPDKWKPLAGFFGNLFGGGAAGLAAHGAGKVVSAAAQGAKDYVAPLTEAGRTRTAAGVLDSSARENGAAPGELAAALDQPSPDLVPGSKPTTFQLTGDKGVGRLEQGVAQVRRDEFVGRREEQNAARQDVVKGLQKDGSPEDVASFLRGHIDNLDNEGASEVAGATARARGAADDLGGNGTPEGYGAAIRDAVQPGIDRATGQARDATEALGGAGTPEEIGAAVRAPLQAGKASAGARRSALYNAIDPDNSLNIVASPVRDAAREVSKSIDPLAAPATGEEAAITKAASSLPEVVGFNSLRALDTRITEAMRAERAANGESAPWRRLVQLKSALGQAIDNGVANQVAWERSRAQRGGGDAAGGLEDRVRQWAERSERDAAAGESVRTGTAGGRGSEGAPSGEGGGVGAARATDAGSGVPEGGAGVASRPAEQPDLNRYPVSYPGGNVDVRYEVVPHSDLVTSHDADFRENPAYPQNLQPRDRSTPGARDQVNTMAARMDPARLGPNREANSGAPIVGPDGIVESGNGRTLAIGRMYDTGRGDAYRAELERQGFDTKGIDRPVLVGRRTTELTPAEREHFAHSANASTGLRMTAAEQATSDARHIAPESLDRLQPGALSSAENRDFVRSILDRMPVAERGSMLDKDGQLSQGGVRRIEAALAARAYGDAGFVSRAFDSADQTVRSVSHALVDAAGPWARMRAAAARGDIDAAHDVTPDLMRTLELVERARSEGRPAGEYLRQGDIFGAEGSDVAKGLIFKDPVEGKLASRSRIAENLRGYAEEAEKNTAGDNLFGDTKRPGDVAEAVRARNERNPDVEEPAPSSPTPTASEPMTEGPLKERAPNFDQGAADRLTDAKRAHADYAQTYRNGPVGEVLRSSGLSNQFKVSDAAVPGRIFKTGPTGGESVAAYRRAVGNDGAALDALQNYAAASLRRAAERPDGTLDPARFTSWLRQHGDALRGMPGLAERFANAARATRAIADFVPFRADLAPSAVPEQFFMRGPGGAEGVAQLRRLVGNDRAATLLGDYAASRLVNAARDPATGMLIPSKVAKWRADHSDALRAFPELDKRFASAAKASEQVAEVAAQRAQQLKDAKAGAVGKLMGATEPEDVTREVGKILTGKNAVAEMKNLAEVTANNPEARDGLRRAVADELARRVTSTAEMGTSGVDAIKSDTFQRFVGDNRAALSAVLTPEEMRGLDAVAADLKRANRSIVGVNVPGGSDTTQKLLNAMQQRAKTAVHRGSILSELAPAGVAFMSGHVMTAGGLAGGAVGKQLLAGMREAGMHKVDDLVARALLDPAFARELLKALPPGTKRLPEPLATRLGRLSMFSVGDDQGNSSKAVEAPPLTIRGGRDKASEQSRSAAP